MKPSKYRADIDGLRAVAVLSVLAFHMGISRMSGGFVGVDVFFVISGYLISSIIFAEIEAGRFSIIGFYERRIRRIFPAIFALLAIASCFATVYLLPTEFVNFAKSALAATLSASNFYFWQHTGYFNSPTSQPLLHTWSLAVEEQFYILFPLFLIAVRKFSLRRLRASVVILFCLSLLVSALVVVKSRQTAFYMPYTRAWELLIGTILSLRMLPRLQSSWQRNLATVCGMGMIGISVLFFTNQTLFPGLSALLPCVGSALIIWAGEAGSSMVGALLSCRPFVFIGLISYSLYLWHWPIVVLRHMGLLVSVGAVYSFGHSALISPHRIDLLLDVTLSFILAVLSWRFVETPFRTGRLRLGGRPLFTLASAVLLLLVGFSASTVLAGGFRGRFPPNAVEVAAGLDASSGARDPRVGTCFITSENGFESFKPSICLREDGYKNNYLLLGDSHSAMLWSALSSALSNANVMQASTFDCPPLLHSESHRDCREMMTYIFQTYLPSHKVQGLLLVARWSEKNLPDLATTIAWAKQHNIPVTVFGPVPEYDGPLPRLLAYSIAWNEPKLASQHRLHGNAALDALMQSLSSKVWHVHYISLYQEICGPNGCAVYADQTHQIPMMDDDNHLNRFGATVVVRRLVAEGKLQ